MKTKKEYGSAEITQLLKIKHHQLENVIRDRLGLDPGLFKEQSYLGRGKVRFFDIELIMKIFVFMELQAYFKSKNLRWKIAKESRIESGYFKWHDQTVSIKISIPKWLKNEMEF